MLLYNDYISDIKGDHSISSEKTSNRSRSRLSLENKAFLLSLGFVLKE